MPNWCENNLKVDGKEKEIKSFMKNMKDENGEITFEKLLPMPDDTEDWYDWNVDNWGTKGYNSYSNFKDDFISFETAWSPPIPFLETVSTKYPNLKFTLTYVELGNNYCGLFAIKNGKIIKVKEDMANSNLGRELFGKEYIDDMYGELNEISDEQKAREDKIMAERFELLLKELRS